MENYREVTVLDNSNTSNVNRNSLAREKYRYLNSSHRNSNHRTASHSSNRGDRQTYRSSNHENYYSGYSNNSQSESFDEEKIAREFRRLMISTAIVGVAVFAKVLDFGVANAIENKFRTSLQTTSQIDNKISNSMVSFGQKVGINLDEISNKGDNATNSNSDNSNIVTDINSDINTSDSLINDDTNTNSTDVIGEISDVNDGNTSDNVSNTDNNVDIADEQISDFYIDDEILESVFEDGKK